MYVSLTQNFSDMILTILNPSLKKYLKLHEIWLLLHSNFGVCPITYLLINLFYFISFILICCKDCQYNNYKWASTRLKRGILLKLSSRLVTMLPNLKKISHMHLIIYFKWTCKIMKSWASPSIKWVLQLINHHGVTKIYFIL